VKLGVGIGVPFSLSRGSGVAPFTPLDLFASAETGGWYRADLGANSVSLWEDQTTNNNDLTQAVAGNQFAVATGLNGKACYRQEIYNDDFFNIPGGVSVDRRNHSWWMVVRPRSVASFGGTRGFVSFGTGYAADTYLNSGTVQGAIGIIGTASQFASQPINTDLILVTCRANATNVRFTVNGRSFTLASPLTAGSVTGGRVGNRSDGYSISGELYEFGLIGRVLTDGEITSLKSYQQSQYGRTWPTYGNVAIFGDSLTEGQGIGANTYVSWPRLLDDDIGATYRQINYSAGGIYLSDLAANVSKCTQGYDAAFTKNIAVIWIGINDCIRGDSSATIIANYQTVVNALTAAGYYVIACTIAPTAVAGWSGAKETVRTAVNTAITTPTITGLTASVNLSALPELDDPNDATYYLTDKLHLQNATFTYVKDAVKTAVLAV
jgi:lysophospholipase L1-like esterase